MIELNNISKSFKKNCVLDGVNLKFRIGDLVHIGGINGSGKSTLLKVISGLVLPDKGEILISDSGKIGASIETPVFIENESLKSNLKFLSNIASVYDRNYVFNLCVHFDLDIDSVKKMKHFSVGMRKKASIIQALMERQNILLFDEPYNGLDKTSQEQLSDLIRTFHHRSDKLIILCSHDHDSSLAFNHRFVLKEGKLVEI